MSVSAINVGNELISVKTWGANLKGGKNIIPTGYEFGGSMDVYLKSTEKVNVINELSVILENIDEIEDLYVEASTGKRWNASRRNKRNFIGNIKKFGSSSN